MPEKPQSNPPKRPGPPQPQRPVARAPIPRPLAPRPVAPQPGAYRPAVAAPRSSGSGSAIAIILLTLAAGGGAAWHFSHPQQPQVKPTPAPVVAVIAEATPAPAPKPTPRPIPITPAIAAAPKPMDAAPAPMVNTPAPPTPESKPMPVAVAADIFQAPLALDEIAGRSPAVLERSAKTLRVALEENKLASYLDLLHRSLAAELKKSPDFDTPQRYERYTGSPLFMRAMLQHALGALVTADAQALIANDDRVRQLVVWLNESPDAMESLLRAITPKDKMASVLATWATLALDDADALGKYRELAIACSVVLEKPIELDWEHTAVKITAADRYKWYKEHDKAGKLATKLTTMDAWQLAWVVGVPVPPSEMEWAIAELEKKLKQSDWGRSYDMVPYDMQKAVTGKMKNPYDYYTFSEILKKGGICGDRAYFSANTARSVGIPAVSISGDGPLGPHAWMAWLAQNDRWAFSGRFGGYPAGRVSDPRNGDKITEQNFTRLSDSNAPSRLTSLKAQRLVWLCDLQLALDQAENADQALTFALKTSPHEAELWERKIAVWRAKKPTPSGDVWRPFLDALKKEFRDDTDMLALSRKAEDEFILSKLDAATAKNELRSDIRHLAKTKGLTSLDEIRVAYKREADLFTKVSDFASLRRLYREALDDYGNEPSKFKGLARDYWALMASAPKDLRASAARDIDSFYQHQVETKSGGYFDVKSQNSAAEVVIQCFRDIGETAKADKLEKEITKRGDKATKNAL